MISSRKHQLTTKILQTFNKKNGETKQKKEKKYFKD